MEIKHYWTQRVKHVLTLASMESKRLNSNYIGTEHLLLGLLREEGGLAAKLLVQYGLTLPMARLHVMRLIDPGKEIKRGNDRATTRLRTVLSLAGKEAQELGHSYIGTEHLLLGLLREGGGVGAKILLEQGLELDDVRQSILNLVDTTHRRGAQHHGQLPLVGVGVLVMGALAYVLARKQASGK